MSQPNPLQRLKDALLGSRPTADEQRRQRASQFFERMREQPEDAPPPAADRTVSFSAATDLLAPAPPPALPAALDVARELERAQDNGLLNTAVRHIRKEAEAEAQVGAQVRSKLDTRREIVDSSTQLLQAQNTPQEHAVRRANPGREEGDGTAPRPSGPPASRAGAAAGHPSAARRKARFAAGTSLDPHPGRADRGGGCRPGGLPGRRGQ